MNYFLYTFLLLLVFNTELSAQEPTTSELYQTFVKMDSLIFEEGFNKCNLQPLEELLTEDLEFYHDVAGIQNKEQFIKAMRDNICSNTERKPMRKLTPKTMKVFPLYDNGTLYGAIVRGKHEFLIKEPNKEMYSTGYALFSTLWIKENENWKARRLYSYHHQPID